MQGGVDIDEALERTQTTEARKGKKKVNPKTILSAWSKYETYKTKQLGDVDQDNWNKEYGGEKLKVNDIVIFRVEQLYPFPAKPLVKEIKKSILKKATLYKKQNKKPYKGTKAQ